MQRVREGSCGDNSRACPDRSRRGCPFERSSKVFLLAVPRLLVVFCRRILWLGLAHFLGYHFLRRLRPLPLLIPPIMKRLVRPLLFHIPSLHRLSG
jgi:hypothetical protein